MDSGAVDADSIENQELYDEKPKDEQHPPDHDAPSDESHPAGALPPYPRGCENSENDEVDESENGDGNPEEVGLGGGGDRRTIDEPLVRARQNLASGEVGNREIDR